MAKPVVVSSPSVASFPVKGAQQSDAVSLLAHLPDATRYEIGDLSARMLQILETPLSKETHLDVSTGNYSFFVHQIGSRVPTYRWQALPQEPLVSGSFASDRQVVEALSARAHEIRDLDSRAYSQANPDLEPDENVRARQKGVLPLQKQLKIFYRDFPSQSASALNALMGAVFPPGYIHVSLEERIELCEAVIRNCKTHSALGPLRAAFYRELVAQLAHQLVNTVDNFNTKDPMHFVENFIDSGHENRLRTFRGSEESPLRDIVTAADEMVFVGRTLDKKKKPSTMFAVPFLETRWQTRGKSQLWQRDDTLRFKAYSNIVLLTFVSEANFYQHAQEIVAILEQYHSDSEKADRIANLAIDRDDGEAIDAAVDVLDKPYDDALEQIEAFVANIARKAEPKEVKEKS